MRNDLWPEQSQQIRLNRRLLQYNIAYLVARACCVCVRAYNIRKSNIERIKSPCVKTFFPKRYLPILQIVRQEKKKEIQQNPKIKC